MKRVLIVYNPISGSGRAFRSASNLALSLNSRGHQVEVHESMPALSEALARLQTTDVLVICGGDGTLRLWLPALTQTHCAIWMYPSGNESLFAREFRMAAQIEDFMKALDRWQIATCDVGCVGSEYFATMLSVGLDAEVVRQVSRRRRKPIGDIGYVFALPTAFRTFHIPQLTISVDGQMLADNEHGYFLVGNSRQFAKNLCFVPMADPQDGLLDFCFIPHQSRKFYLHWLGPLLGGEMQQFANTRRVRGLNAHISSRSSAVAQVDGDFLGELPLELQIRPRCLRVFLAPNCELG